MIRLALLLLNPQRTVRSAGTWEGFERHRRPSLKVADE